MAIKGAEGLRAMQEGQKWVAAPNDFATFVLEPG